MAEGEDVSQVPVSLPWMWLLLVGIMTIVSAVVTMRTTSSRKKLPPGPRGYWLVGSLLSLSLSEPPEVAFAKIAAQYGELVLVWMGSRPTVLVSSARMAMEFLKTHDAEFSNRPDRVASKYVSFNATSLISMPASDPHYQRMRRLFVTELLSPKKIAASRDVRKEQMLKLLRGIYQDSEAGQSVNLMSAVSTLGMNITMCTIFGRQYYDMIKPKEIETLVPTFRKVVKLLGVINIGDLIPAIRWLDVQRLEPQFKDVEVLLRKSLMALIEKKKLEMRMWSPEEVENGASESDIMAKLLSLEGEEQLSDDQLMSVVFVLLIASSDSIARGIGKALEELLKQPTLYKRAVDELDRVVGKMRLVEESDIPNLPSIQNIVKETLRIHPAAQLLIPHRNFEPCEVAGYHIPANSSILINLYALSRDPSFWDNPLEFSPDRFTDSKLMALGNDFHYIPFGFGRRGCPGFNLGMATFQSGLALCLQCFDWRLSAGINKSDSYVAWNDKSDLLVDAVLRVEPHLLNLPH